MEGNQKTVVVIEDDEDFLGLVKLMLADTGLQLVPALGGREGLDAIRQVQPDLVILDLVLPDLSGWEVFMQMRAEPATMGGMPRNSKRASDRQSAVS